MASPAHAQKPSPLATARKVDALIEGELAKAHVTPVPLVNDDTFLRRATLDLAGTIPTPDQITDFALDPDPNKRGKLVDRLLKSDEYADIWASYWREVIFSRATEARARVMQDLFEGWMKDQLTQNTGWDKIATELLTATGSTKEDGDVALIFAHTGEPEELAAETARIFLGIQIQCANCHNHPYEKWTREDFHQFAAFFPRIQVRAEPDDPATFIVRSVDQLAGGRASMRANFDPAQAFLRMDQNRDGKITKTEVSQAKFLADRFDQILALGDSNKDGAMSKEEFEKVPRPDNNQPGRGSAEHYMPDLDDPTAEGKLMQPVFFVNHAKMNTGTEDMQRRETLAKYITARNNPWFAQSFVNRIWAELVGQPFTDMVDDMGPGHEAQTQTVLDVLATDFVNSGYDIRWLYRVITHTNAYQRKLRTSDIGEGAFAAASPTRLRSDQIYNGLVAVLGEGIVPQSRGTGGPLQRFNNQGGRKGFAQLFGFDPSTPQADIIGTVPQALFLMNQGGVNGAIRVAGRNRLVALLEKNQDNHDALSELYLLVLSREPSKSEVELNLAYLTSVGNRSAAFEDILWALLNSSEFITKR
jgi:Ca2+-binding EF-hand superfamily protein